mmetsp:Transcript_7759/g.16468  ORF Transcript_7759/g.16468 Transcript_7759/m.16468 type:complete len:92 (-) Transcript_7759:149-424(-)
MTHPLQIQSHNTSHPMRESGCSGFQFVISSWTTNNTLRQHLISWSAVIHHCINTKFISGALIMFARCFLPQEVSLALGIIPSEDVCNSHHQ